MLDTPLPYKKPLIQQIRPEVKQIYDQLPDNIREMYRNETCQMCGAHLTVRQLNRIITKGVPPVCLNCYKKMQGQLQELAPLFNQLGLF